MAQRKALTKDDLNPMVRNLPALMLFVAVAVPPGGADEGIELSPHWRAGDNAYVEISQVVEQSVAPVADGAAPIRTHIETTHGLRRKIVRAGADGFRIEYTLDRFRHAIRSDALTFACDSDAPATASAPAGVAAALRSVLGGQASLEIDAGGDIRFFSGLGDARRELERVAAENVVLAKVRDDLDDDACRFRWGQALLAPYAFRKVKPGDRWQREIQQTNPSTGRLAYLFEFELREVTAKEGRPAAIITYKGNVRGLDPPPSRPGGLEMSLRDGTFSGAAQYDVQRGEMIAWTQDAELTVDVARRAPDGARSAAMTLRQKIGTTVGVLTIEQRDAQRTARSTPSGG